MSLILRVGTRPSPLALKQVKEVQTFLNSVTLVAVPIETRGDKDKRTPLSVLEDTDFFTHEIDEALLNESIDLAIHSSKDLPAVLAKGLAVIFETASVSPYDALVSRDNLKFRDLPIAARIGVSSRRRKDQVLAQRGDLKVVDIRGNVQERLNLITEGQVDALIVAHAAMIRLGLEGRIAEILDPAKFVPHPKQGRISLVAKENRCQEVRSILSELVRETQN
jgi:hydroxymethylbilane synthase